MRIFCINLDHRTDRRHYMEAQFEALGMTVERIRATTPADIQAADLAPLTFEDARRRLMPTEIATSISHHRAWRRMLEEGDPIALILEDDCELSPRLPAFLAAAEQEARLSGVIRIETRQIRQVLARRPARSLGGVRLHQPLTWEWGAAAYLISADEARRILASSRRFDLPIDDTMLSPASPLHLHGRVLQTVPALAFVPDEDVAHGSQPASVRHSDAQEERQARFRTEKPKRAMSKIMREVGRIGNQVADARTYVRHWVFGRAVAVPFAGGSAPVASTPRSEATFGTNDAAD